MSPANICSDRKFHNGAAGMGSHYSIREPPERGLQPPSPRPQGVINDATTPIRQKSSAHPVNLGLFPGAPAVRKVKRRNYNRAFSGNGGDHKALGAAPFCSLNERDARILLGANPQIVHYAIEPHTLEYFIPNKKGGFDRHTYVPDIVCRYRSGEIVVLDPKADYFATLPDWTAKERFIREAYEIDHGAYFVVVNASFIAAEPRLSNAKILERHRYIAKDLVALGRTRDTLLKLGLPTTVDAVIRTARLNDREGECRAYTALMNLALEGEIHLDLSLKFSRTTVIMEGLGS